MSDLKDLIWRIQEKMPVDHAELLDLANQAEVQAAEIERLREALKMIARGEFEECDEETGAWVWVPMSAEGLSDIARAALGEAE